MLDIFRNENPEDYIRGFPDHAHRGFETVTYMIAGRMRHHDSVGNEGLLGPGGAQWMTTGSGLVHSELPEQESGLMEGFQLWLNLPAKNKVVAPSYRDIPPTAIPEFRTGEGVRVRVIAGTVVGDRHMAILANQWRGGGLHRSQRGCLHAAHRRVAAEGADCAVRPLRDEQQRGNFSGGARLRGRQIRGGGSIAGRHKIWRCRSSARRS